MPIELHRDDPDLLRAAIGFTAAETGFPARLVEKDYFCAGVLESITMRKLGVVFKGGTCLAKVHGDFFRLSEDLDFSIPVETGTGRAVRRRLIEPVRAMIEEIETALPGFDVESGLIGANNSTQYNAVLQYKSLVDGQAERIKLEIGLREPILLAAETLPASTLVRNPLTNGALIEPVLVDCLSFEEATAEKVRATITRRDVAIRDFFDVDHIAMAGGLDLMSDQFLELLRQKLAVSGTGPIDISDRRMSALRRQLDAELRPVLRASDFEQFDLERAIELVRRISGEM